MDELRFLLTKLKNGEMSYFDNFYQLTKSKVFYMSYSITRDTHSSEDILQETYLKFLDSLNRIKEDENIFSYLMQISKNLSLNYVKRRNKEEDIDNYIVSSEDEDIDPFVESDVYKLMKETLNDNEFQIVILHVVNDMTHKEISELLKKPIGTVLWAYNNAIKKLRSKEDDRNRIRKED